MKPARTETADRLVSLSAALNRTQSVEAAIDQAIQAVETVYDTPLAVIWDCGSDTQSPTALAASATSTDRLAGPSWTAPKRLAESDTVTDAIGERGETTTANDPRDPLRGELLVAIDSRRALGPGAPWVSARLSARLSTSRTERWHGRLQRCWVPLSIG